MNTITTEYTIPNVSTCHTPRLLWVRLKFIANKIAPNIGENKKEQIYTAFGG